MNVLSGIINIIKSIFHSISTICKKAGNILFLPALIIYLGLVSRIFCAVSYRGFILALLFDISAGFFFAGIAMLFRKKINRRITMIIGYVLTVWYIFMSIIHNSYNVYMSVSNVLAGAGNVAGDFGGAVFSAIIGSIPKIIIFAAPIVLYTIFGKKHIRIRRMKPQAGLVTIAFSLIVFVITMLICQIGGLKEAYKTSYNYDIAVRTFGMFTGTRLDLKYMIFGNNSTKSLTAVAEEEPSTEAETAEAETETEEVIDYGKNEMDLDFSLLMDTGDEYVDAISSYVSTLTASDKNEYTGLFEGKNLILICAESFSYNVINPDMTPALYRMSHNGFYFSNYYQPLWGGSTSTGEFSEILGLAPQDGIESILYTEGNNNYFTMGNQLQRLNYYNAAFHNGDCNYYERMYTHNNLGYVSWIADGSGMEDIITDTFFYSDIGLFADTLPYYIDKQPFSVYYMTYSGHAAYIEDCNFTYDHYDFVNSIFGDTISEKLKYYYCYQMELEIAMENLIESLEEAGIADDTVIVITGDHYPYGLTESDAWENDRDYLPDLLGDDCYEPWNRDRSELIIWSGCLENEDKDMACEISAPCFSLDILPTLSNLFGLEYDSRLLVGRDVFSDAEPIVFWNDGSWLTEKGRYNFEDGTYYPDDGSENNDSYVSRISSIVDNRLNMSYMIYHSDYYYYLFGGDYDYGQEILPQTQYVN